MAMLRDQRSFLWGDSQSALENTSIEHNITAGGPFIKNRSKFECIVYTYNDFMYSTLGLKDEQFAAFRPPPSARENKVFLCIQP